MKVPGLIACFFILTTGYSQTLERQLFSSAGSSNDGISWSIGEPLTQSLQSSGALITQGFQQTNLWVTSVSESALPTEILVYPNPIMDELTIDLSALETSMELELFDSRGRLVERKVSGPELLRWSSRSLMAGVYNLRISNPGSSNARVFRIVKMN